MRGQTKVLVADDNRVVRETMRLRLADWGIEAVLAVDGEEAWRLLQGARAPRIAILDWSMPGADGLEVCRRVRAAQRDHYTYLILLTAHDGEEAIATGFAAGADDYVSKDSPPHVLCTRVTVAQRIAAVQDELLGAREILRQQARHDSLTGLLNRRAGDEELERELRRVGRGSRSFSVVLLDLDHFKAINDSWGHSAGDHVLATLAEVLKSVLRAEDVVARWGGEEFLVLLPQVDLEGAAAAAERIRTAVLETAFQLPQGSLRVSVSLGVTAVPDGGRPKAAILASADAALYRAKANGRNCVVIEEPATVEESYPMLVRVLEMESSRLIACTA